MSAYPQPGATCLLHGKRVSLNARVWIHEYNGSVCGSQRFAVTWHMDRLDAVDALEGMRAARELMER